MADRITRREFELEQRRADDLREADKHAVGAALLTAEKAADRIRDLQQETNVRQNEWRQAMLDLIASHKEALSVIMATLVTKDDQQLRFTALTKETQAERSRIETRVNAIEDVIAAGQSKSDVATAIYHRNAARITWAIAVTAVLMTVITIVITVLLK